MRTVCFVERIELVFNGNILNQALAFGDVDNDKVGELVVGNINGDLAIFKGSNNQTAWRKCADLGMITCVGIGDVYNCNKNILLVLTAEGWCYLFDLSCDSPTESLASKDSGEDGETPMQPLYTQHLPANSKVMMLADIDGNGQTELIVGYSDRVVRSFRWQYAADGQDSQGSLLQLDKWQLAGQIGSITLNQSSDGSPELMAAQPGGSYVTLLASSSKHHSLDLGDNVEGETCTVPSLVYSPLSSSRARNSSISTEILGCIHRGRNSGPGYCALVTLDGTMKLLEDDHILWSLQVDHQLFSLSKLDITGNGQEEVVVCSWDGQTYIVNHKREVVRFQFNENVAAFAAGDYAVSENENVPCFAYATFNNRIYIYYKLWLPQVESTNLLEVMARKERVQQLLQHMHLKDLTADEQREFYHWCLYGQHKDVTNTPS